MSKALKCFLKPFIFENCFFYTVTYRLQLFIWNTLSLDKIKKELQQNFAISPSNSSEGLLKKLVFFFDFQKIPLQTAIFIAQFPSAFFFWKAVYQKVKYWTLINYIAIAQWLEQQTHNQCLGKAMDWIRTCFCIYELDNLALKQLWH